MSKEGCGGLDEPACCECHAMSRKMIPIIVDGNEEHICIRCLKEELK